MCGVALMSFTRVQVAVPTSPQPPHPRLRVSVGGAPGAGAVP